MPRWTLIDIAQNHHYAKASLGLTMLKLPEGWSVELRTLHGGLREGVQVIEVRTPGLDFDILPTRGMGLWRGEYNGHRLGWRAPVRGPVHPKFVPQSEFGGIGWLLGFDEWLVRCGLGWNGPPGTDRGTPLTLHGRIANTPAHLVEIESDPTTGTLSLHGEVEEGGLFLPHLLLKTTYSIQVADPYKLTITDTVINRSAQPAEMELLYHMNFGEPLLAAGATVSVPHRTICPQTERAAEGIDTWATYEAPTVGFAEQVYLVEPLPDEQGRGSAMLAEPFGLFGVRLDFPVAALPCFTVWKNTGALADGYVTGLEPATNFPNFRAFERERGRVPILAPGESWTATWSVRGLNAVEIEQTHKEFTARQAKVTPVVHRRPEAKFTPKG